MAGSLPRRAVRFIPAAFFRPQVAAHVIRYRSLFDPVILWFDFPDSYPPQFLRNKALDAKYVYWLEDVIVSPHSGLVWTPSDWLFVESAGSIDKIMFWGQILHELLLPVKRLPAESWHVAVPQGPFYHFMWDVLPALLMALRVDPSVRLLLYPNPPRYVVQALELLFGPLWRERAVFSKSALRVRRLIMPQQEAFSGFVHPDHALDVVRVMGDKITLPPPGTRNRVYVSRKRAPRDPMGGEAELEAALAQRGFTILTLEQMSLREQFEAFSGAAFLVTPHGAGLSHLPFCPAESTLYEIFPQEYFNDCYARLALQLGMRYGHNFCRPSKRFDGGDMNVEVILREVDALLEKAG